MKLGLAHLNRSSLQNLQRASDAILLAGKFKGMRDAFENKTVEKRVLYEHAAKLIQARWRWHQKHTVARNRDFQRFTQATVKIQSLFRARKVRKMYLQKMRQRVLSGGFPKLSEGWITKRGHIFRTWKKRWFVVENGQVTYYVDESKTNEKGSLSLNGYFISNHSKILEGELYLSTDVSGGKDLLLRFKDSNERDHWNQVFNSHIQAFNMKQGQALAKVGFQCDNFDDTMFDRI